MAWSAGRLAWVGVAALVVGAGSVGACGARSGLYALAGGPGGGGGGGGQGGEAGAGAVGGGPPECVVYNSVAALAPLDVFVVLDASGSMSALTSDGQVKWQAVRDALAAFFVAEDSEGIGIGLTFFPIIDRAVPDTCFTDVECGVPDACIPNRYCPQANISCDEDQDCIDAGFPNDKCELLGLCQNAPLFVYCIQGYGPPWNCAPEWLPCVNAGACENRFTCESEAYEQPVVDVAPLPGSGNAVLAAIDAKTPDGATPTLPALTGTSAHALAWAAAHPERKVIVVLATDGVPTVCDHDIQENPDQGVLNLAEVASATAMLGVVTFVIGVFSPEEQIEAQTNLDTIAAAGGTEQAFVITNAVTQQIVDALNEVRVTAESCEFTIVPGPDPIDYTTVWVRLTPTEGATPVWVARRSGPAACDPETGGFYYDVPVPGAQTPSRVILCPASCELFGSSPDRQIEIYTACDPMMEG
jgi:hypothetical protein